MLCTRAEKPNIPVDIYFYTLQREVSMSFSEKRDLSAQQPLKITFFTLLTLVLCLIFLPSSFSATINLAWNSSTGLNVAGYKVYYGSASKSYSKNVNVGNNTSCSLSGLTEGRKYYFAATAYNASNNESDYSSEISYTIPVSSSNSSSTSSSSTTGSTNTLIIDNGSSGTSATGSWKVSSASGFYGSNSIYSNTKASTYSFQATRSGSQRVYFWYTQFSNRCTSVPVAIYDGSTLLKTVTVNQQKNGAQWNDLGTYAFSSSAKVVATAPGSCITSVDAIKFAPASSTSAPTPTTSTSTSGSSNTAIIDNGSSGTSATGSWKVSSASGFYGSNSVYSDRSSDTYSFEAPVSGSREVHIWYTQYSNRCKSVPIKIYSGSTDLDTVNVNQQQNGGQWNDLGTYDFDGKAKIIISSNGGCITSADAVKLVPTSSAASATSSSSSEPPATGSIIVDNGDNGTMPSGSWKVSSAPGFYASSSLYSVTASNTYAYEAACSGVKEVYLWWVSFDNRCTKVPVRIYDGSTYLETVEVNQQQNGGQWNELGTYSFSGRARVVVVSNGGCVTSADAVNFFEPN